MKNKCMRRKTSLENVREGNVGPLRLCYVPLLTKPLEKCGIGPGMAI